MLGRKGIVLALCIVMAAQFAYGISEQEELFHRFKQEHIQEVALATDRAQIRPDNIFYLGADQQEWVQIEAILDLYFIGLTKDNQPMRQKQLEKILQLYGVNLRNCNPIGLYHIGRDEVDVDFSLFTWDANPAYTKSIIYHEKVHQKQNRTYDRDILRVDQRQRYAEKLEEIAAHYLQIAYVLTLNDPVGLEMALRNSNRWNMFPGILELYPENDEVILIIRNFIDSLAS